ncbi:GAF domain-containing protein [Pseudomonas sp. PDM13]|uniref:GAF domain-containing protein n=1 Tax=Pseudomonas sp. PDM13 TaxID=2769255 RepID=UPI0021DF87A2|nr:GAF domain-containing protein [Pseudomonas sp. PDM13]MCU9947907.1 GAF domain-containing protein [Pseudomonas sp. PDM13]
MRNFEALKSENERNKEIETNTIHAVVIFANTWTTLFAPILIGFFITKLFTNADFSESEKIIATISSILHVLFTYVIYRTSTRRSLSLEVDRVFAENEHYKKSVIPKAVEVFETGKIQQTVIYLMTLDLENIIDEINNRPESCTQAEKLRHWEEGLNRILDPLVKYRHELFSYKGNQLHNICLYLYNQPSDNLIIEWRNHDNRLKTSNRSWKPGLGHVGLTFILNEIKICHDICASTELSSSASTKEDKAKYRSFLSVPIKDSAKIISGGKPLGVLVFTSNACEQFSLERDKIFALTVAKILSIYIEKCFKSMH